MALDLIRSAVTRLWVWAKRKATVTVTITERESAFAAIDAWLATSTHGTTARNAMLRTSKVDDEKWWLTLGDGEHRLKFDWGILYFSRSSVSKEGQADQSIIALTTIGRGQERIKLIISEAMARFYADKKLEIRAWDQSYRTWRVFARPHVRSLESLILDAKFKCGLTEGVVWFFKSKQWFIDRGLPHRQGWMFEGDPGGGKTTTAMVLAGIHGLPIYNAVIGSISGDGDLLKMFSEVPSDCLLLIEDIDRIPIARGEVSKERGGITLSGLLNAVDGVMSSDGRLLIITTNHPELLDPALIRPGRIDRRWKFEALTCELATEMARRFFQADLMISVATTISDYMGPRLSASTWQRIFVECNGREDRVASLLADYECTRSRPHLVPPVVEAESTPSG